MPLRTADNNFGTAKWIVSGAYSDGCTHTTIASAITSASSGDTIFIRPGTYTENLTLKAGVNLTAYTNDGLTPTVTIIGKLSFSSAGTVGVSGIRLQTNSDNILAVTGSSASIVNIYDCYLNITNATAIVNSSSNSGAYVTIARCDGNIANTGITLFSHSSAGITDFKYTQINNSANSTTRSTCSAGGLYIRYCDFSCPITTSSTGFIGMGYSSLTGFNVPALIHGGRADSSLQHVNMQGINAATITVNNTLTIYFAVLYSVGTTCINGSSNLKASNIIFADNSVVTCTYTDVTTLSGTINLKNQVSITSGSGTPNAVVSANQGSLYLRTNGSSSTTRSYINTNGATTWTANNSVS